MTRKKKLIWLLIVVAFLLIIWGMNYITTPVPCRVPLEKMPKWCIPLIYN